MIRIRFKTWYWGKWILSETMLNGTMVTNKTEGFEEYDEEKHGLHNEPEEQEKQAMLNSNEWTSLVHETRYN